MSTVTIIGRRIRSANRRRSLERAVVHLHATVRDEVLSRAEADPR